MNCGKGHDMIECSARNAPMQNNDNGKTVSPSNFMICVRNNGTGRPVTAYNKPSKLPNNIGFLKHLNKMLNIIAHVNFLGGLSCSLNTLFSLTIS